MITGIRQYLDYERPGSSADARRGKSAAPGRMERCKLCSSPLAYRHNPVTHCGGYYCLACNPKPVNHGL